MSKMTCFQVGWCGGLCVAALDRGDAAGAAVCFAALVLVVLVPLAIRGARAGRAKP